MGLSSRDRQAMAAAIEMARAEDEGRERQIHDFLRSRPWEDVGDFASYHCQMRSLGLRPWQTPPCWIEPRDIPRLTAGLDDDRPSSGKREAAELLQRMLALGISRYSPDPLAAIAAAEAAKRPAA